MLRMQQPEEKPERKVVTFRLDPDLWIRFKKCLLDNDTSIQTSMEGYAQRYVATYEGKAKQ